MLLSLVFFVFCMVFSQVDKTYSLQCSRCHSSISWQDCMDRQTIADCSSSSNRCRSYHNIITLPNGQQTHEYQKDCDHEKNCSSIQCLPSKEVKQPRCSVDCCNTTLCNKGVPQLRNEVQAVFPTTRVNIAVKKYQRKKSTAKLPYMWCYQCSSSKSWEDCNKIQKLIACPPEHPHDACTTYHRVLTLPSGQQEHEYEKGCWIKSHCSNEQCRMTNARVKGSWCDMRCCSSSECNRPGFKNSIVNKQVMAASTNNAIPYQLLVLTAVVFAVSGLF